MDKTIEGTVCQRFSQARLGGATVRLEPQEGTNGTVALANSNDDGRFQINIDELKHGNYVLTAFHQEAGPIAPRKLITIKENKSIIIVEGDSECGRIKLEIEPKDIVSDRAGVTFLTLILITLIGIVGFYCHLHNDRPAKPLPINKQIAVLIDQAIVEALKTDSNNMLIKKKTNDARKLVNAMYQAQTIGLDILTVAETLFDNLDASIEKKQNEDVLSYLRLIDESLRKEPIYFWQESPLNLLEMLFWAVAATLIRLAMNTGRYLRLRNFHFNAIPHHIGYFFAVPIMAVLIALIVSFLNLDFKFGSSGVSLDFSNIVVSIVIASLVGLTPWRASEFLEDLADTFFNKLKNALPNHSEAKKEKKGEAKIPPSSEQPAIATTPEIRSDVSLVSTASPPSEPIWASPPISGS